MVLFSTGIPVSSPAAQTKRYKLQELDVPTIRTQLAAFTGAERNRPLVNAAKAVANVVDANTVGVQYNKDVPRLDLSFLPTADPAGPIKPVKDLALEFVHQLLAEEPEYQKILPNIGVTLRRRTEAAAGYDVFQAPAGLSTPVDQLLALRGTCGPNCYPFTPANCFELAKACYRMCMYSDALALLNHAIRHDRQASYYYLKAMTELQLGRCQDGLASVREMLGAQAEGLNEGLPAIMEGYNGPLRAQVDELARFAETNR
jgi:hypothetical protein